MTSSEAPASSSLFPHTQETIRKSTAHHGVTDLTECLFDYNQTREQNYTNLQTITLHVTRAESVTMSSLENHSQTASCGYTQH